MRALYPLQSKTPPHRDPGEGGFTIFELLIAIGLASVLSGIAIASLREYTSGAKNGADVLQGFIKQARAKGMARTAAYRIRPASNTQLESAFGDKCSSTTFTDDTSLREELPTGASFAATTWTLCFSSRGLASENVTIEIRDNEGSTKRVEVMLGGGTREL